MTEAKTGNGGPPMMCQVVEHLALEGIDVPVSQFIGWYVDVAIEGVLTLVDSWWSQAPRRQTFAGRDLVYSIRVRSEERDANGRVEA